MFSNLRGCILGILAHWVIGSSWRGRNLAALRRLEIMCINLSTTSYFDFDLILALLSPKLEDIAPL